MLYAEPREETAKCTPLDLALPTECPSSEFYRTGEVRKHSPSFVLSVQSLDDALGRIIGLRAGGEDIYNKDILSQTLRATAFSYREATEGMEWKNLTQTLPLSSVCSSLTVQQQSELALQFSHHVGLSLASVATVEEYLVSSFSVRFQSKCSFYAKERLLKQAAQFLARFDFLRHTTIDPFYLANIILDYNGRYMPATEWWPKLVERLNLLFTPASDSNFYRYVANGVIQFTEGKCTLRLVSKDRLLKEIRNNPTPLAAQLILDYQRGVGDRPPYEIITGTPDVYWKELFGQDWRKVKTVMATDYMQKEALTTPEAVRIGVVLSNIKARRTSLGEFENLLRSITAANRIKQFVGANPLITRDEVVELVFGNGDLYDQPHLRVKRHPALVAAWGVVSRLVARLIIFFRGWAAALRGSALTASVRSVVTPLQGRAVGIANVARTQERLRAIIGQVGNAQRQLVPFIRHTRTSSMRALPARMLRFGPGRFSSLELPTQARRALAQFTPDRLQLKRRSLDAFQFARRHALLIGSTAATVTLFGVSLDVTSKDLEHYRHPPNTTESDPEPPYWPDSVRSFYAICNGSFVYDPMILSLEERLALQHEMFGQGKAEDSEVPNSTRTALHDETLQRAYSSEVVNPYDTSLPIMLRRDTLLATRRRNVITREMDSMTVAMLEYKKKSLLQKKAVEHAELFYGVLMYQHEVLLPDEAFMDGLLDAVIRRHDLQAFINEVDEYVTLVFIQIQESWSPERRIQFARRARNNTKTTEEDELYDFLTTADPEAKAAFELVLRSKGQDHINTVVNMMDQVLSAEAERRYWLEQGHANHRLLWLQQPLEIPEREADFLSTLFWYQIYMAQEGKKDLLNRFLSAMSRLSTIRVYAENQAVGMASKHLEKSIDAADLEQLKKFGLAGISATDGTGDSATFTDYSNILELANSDEPLLDYSPTMQDYNLDDDHMLNNEHVGLNHIKDTEEYENATETDGRKRRDLYHHQQLRIMAKRNADALLGNLTSDPTLLSEINRMYNDRDYLALIKKRYALGAKPLTITDLFRLQQDINKPTTNKALGIETLKLAHSDYLAEALEYLQVDHDDVPPAMIALLVDTAEGHRLPQKTLLKLQVAKRVLKINPLTSLIEKKALLSFLKTHNVAHTKNSSFTTIDTIIIVLLLLSLAGHIVLAGKKIMNCYKCRYIAVETNVPTNVNEGQELAEY